MRRQSSRFFPHLILVIGLGLTCVITVTSARATRDRNRLRFEREVDGAHASIKNRFELYVAVLRGGAALFAAKDSVDAASFRSFVERLDLPHRYPGTQGMGFSLRVGSSPALPAPHSQTLSVWPASRRSEYHSIVYLQPLDRRNRAALGYDMFSDATRREAMERARDSATAAASGMVTLVQEIDARKQAGFLIFVPVYRSPLVPKTVAERREFLTGFLYAPFRMEDTFRAIFPREYDRVVHIDTYDGPDGNAARRMYSSSGIADDSYRSVRPLRVAGRTWTIVYQAGSGFAAQTESNAAIAILLFGISTSSLLALAAARQSAARRAAEETAAVLSDRTVELRIACENANRSERQYREIVETSQEAIWVTDENAVITFVNGPAASLIGCQTTEMIGRPVFQFLDDDIEAILRRRFDSRQRGASDRCEIDLGRRDGTKRRVRVSATSLFDEHDRFSGTLAMLTDTTSQHLAEKQRDELNRRLELVLESMGEGLIAFDVNLSCALMNQSAARLLGVRASAVGGRPVHEILHRSCEGGCALETALRSGRASLNDDVFDAEGGTSFSAEYAVSPIIAEGEPAGFVLTFRDVTEQRFLRLQLEQAQRLSSLGGLAASIAHEFNNVLMVIQPFADLLSRRTDRSEEVGHAHQQITAAIHRGKRTTEEILAFTRDASPLLEPINVRRYIERLVAQIGPSLSDVSIESRIPEDDLWISGDALQLDQVFSNLLINARDAGATRITLTVEECRSGKTVFPFGTVATPDRFLRFLVTDDGPGMAADVVSRIFEPLFTTKRIGGTGLGLCIAQRVVLRHGGMIDVRSRPGAGTTFEMLLKRELPPADLSAHDQQPPRAAPCRLMIVDDEESIVEAISTLLELEGNQVRSVSTGAEALAAFDDFEPDVLILDVGLPDIDGRFLYSKIQTIRPGLPVIFSTGHATVVPSSHAYLLRKPYEFDSLLQALAIARAERAPDQFILERAAT